MPRPERGVTPAGFRRQLLARLRNQAHAEGISAQRIQQRVAFERLLARLPSSGEWILKGGFALELRYGWSYRPTRDIDLRTTFHPDEALGHLRTAIAESAIPDHFAFELASVSRETRAAPGRGLRTSVVARVAGEELDTFHIDLSCDDALVGHPEILEGSSTLTFANIETIQFPVYPVPLQLAEKLHAYTLPRTDENTRVKDLVDFVSIAAVETVDAQGLITSLHATFNRRGTHDLPRSFPSPPASWAAPFRQIASTSVVAPVIDLVDGARRGSCSFSLTAGADSLEPEEMP
jgi:Nucleotidyl transferase AbiEii toxin, Type IV TA system